MENAIANGIKVGVQKQVPGLMVKKFIPSVEIISIKEIENTIIAFY
jgi:hypothetical protein